MDKRDLLTLAELSERSGVEIRTLRSWIAQGVVPGADTAGRNARYSVAALTRARAVRAMRELYGMPMTEIRRAFLTADDAKIEAYAAMAQPAAATARVEAAPEQAGREEASAPSPTRPDPASAADYLRNLRRAGVFGAAPAGPVGDLRPAFPQMRARTSPPEPPAPPEPADFAPAAEFFETSESAPAPEPAPAAGSRLARLVEALEQVAGPRPPRRRAKSEVRNHIPITPDLELAVRGNPSPEEIARYEQVADLLRVILTGGL